MLRIAAAIGLAIAAACGKGDVTAPRVATRLTVLAGNNQTGPVGGALPTKIRVSASDAQGGVPDVLITASTSGQNGSVSPASVKTNASGEAEFLWTLGPPTGAQTISFSASATVTTTASATGAPGDPAIVLPLTNAFQLVVVGRAAPVLPSVRVTDAFGNAIGGVAVTFDTPVAGSVITGVDRITDATGLATLGSWTIGLDAVIYNVRARIASGSSAVFEARGVPSALNIVGGSGQSGNAGTALPVAPAVKAVRDDGSPLPNVAVTFIVTGGNGQVLGGSANTGADGVAKPTRWILGTAPGPNALEARTFGKDPVLFSATGVPGVASSVTRVGPASQAGFFGNYPKFQPGVTVTDAGGNPVFGASVVFQIVQGDGILTLANRSTDALGKATVGGWRLGSAPTQIVRATVGALAGVDFIANATPVPAGTFKIDVRFLTTPTTAQRAAFDLAVARWTQIIVSGDAPYPVNEPSGVCFAAMPAMNEAVDGVVIFANLVPIDGVNGILGRAGPCIVRDDPGYLSAVGLMEFDTADLTNLEGTGRLNDVILHEMAHVLGFGTIWNFLTNQYLTGQGTGDPFFTGSSARGAFLASGQGGVFTGNAVPVEGSGGPGTRDSHWRETTVTNELMTGFLNPVSNPLSAFSAASFRDLGYVVNDAVTDQFSFLAQLQAPAPGTLPSLQPGLIQLGEAPIAAPIIVINRQGRHVARIPRK